MPAERFVGEHSGRADLDQVAAEFVFEHPVFDASEIDVIVAAEDVEVPPSGVVTIVADAAVALDAAVHLVIDERAEVLVPMRSFFETRAPVVVPGHDRHVLQMTFAAFIADRAIVRMIQHEPFDHAFAESLCFGIVDRYAGAVCGRRHAGHDDLAACVLLVFELFDGTLAARADGSHRRMPAEIGKVETERQALMQKVLIGIDFVGAVVDVNRCHRLSPGASCVDNMCLKSS